MSFGKRLKKLRQENSLTQAQLSSFFNLAESTISLYESGKRSPDYQLLKRFAAHFNVSIDYLLGITDDRNSIDYIKENLNSYIINPCENIQQIIPVIQKIQLTPSGLIFEECPNGYCHMAYTKYDDLFWFCIPDDSMAPDCIMKNDMVLVKKQKELKDGDIGLFIVNREEGRVYRIYQKENNTILQPSNAKFPPRVFTRKERTNILIIGKVLEIRRKL